VNASAIRKRGNEVNVRKRGRKDAAANGEDFGGNTNSFGEITGDVGESGEEEIAEIVAAEATAEVETVLEKLGEQGFVFGEGDQAVADVAGREHAIFAAEATGAATVIGNGDNGGQIDDRALGGGLLIAAANDVLLEAAEKRGKSGAAAESDDTQTWNRSFFGTRSFHQQLKRFHYQQEMAGTPRQACGLKKQILPIPRGGC
jgi:hypothetical protein